MRNKEVHPYLSRSLEKITLLHSFLNVNTTQLKTTLPVVTTLNKKKKKNLCYIFSLGYFFPLIFCSSHR